MAAGVVRACMLIAAVAVGSASVTAHGRQPEPTHASEPEAKSPGVTVAWNAPAACPTAESVRERVERLLGTPLDTARVQRVAADLEVQRAGGRFSLVMEIESVAGVGERRLENEDCELLADAAALILALAVDPLAVMERGQQTGAVQVTPPAEPAKPGPVTTAPVKPQHTLRLGVRLLGGGMWGALPNFGPGVEGAFSLIWRRARLEAVGQYWFSQPARFADPMLNAVGGDLRLWSFGIRGCPVPRTKVVEFPICAGIEAGAMHGEGVNVTQPKSGRSVWVAASAGPAVAWAPGKHLAMWVGVDAVVPIRRPAFDVTNVDKELHRAQFVGIRALAGVEARFR